MINNERLLSEFLDYITIDSETFDEGNFESHIKEILRELDFEILPDKTGKKINSNANNIIARRDGVISGKTLGFCAHLDTVSPGLSIKPIIKNNIIYSQGETILGADDKAGIAVIIEIIRTAIEHEIPLGPVELFFSIAEERGILGSKFVDPQHVKAKDYYILDGTGDPGEVIVKGPGNNQLNMTVKGRPAHAGLCPEQGINAIEVVSHAISQMTLGRNSPVTTSNIGTISGGMATNIVCPEVKLSAEVRSLSEEELALQTDHICQALKEACHKWEADYDIQVDNLYQSFAIEEHNDFLTYTKKIMTDMDLPINVISTGGGSDANNLSKLGVTPIILGIGIKNCHTTDEHISIDTLQLTAEMCYKLMKNYW